MKSLLYSIPPEVCERIANGKQTILLTKRLPKIDTPCKVYMYCTRKEFAWHCDTPINGNPHGKVFGEFIWRGIMHPNDSIKLMAKQSCLSENELDKYARGKTPYGLRITELKIYDKPKELGEFYSCYDCFNSKNIKLHRNLITGDIHGNYRENSFCTHCCKYYNHEFQDCMKQSKPLTRPPQSYCYVEEL